MGRLRDPNAGSLFPVAGEFGELGLLPEFEFELPAALQVLFLLCRLRRRMSSWPTSSDSCKITWPSLPVMSSLGQQVPEEAEEWAALRPGR